MNTQQLILERLDETCRSLDLDDLGDIQWNDAQLLRKCALRAKLGDPTGWREFLAHVNANRRVAWGFINMFENLGWAKYSKEKKRTELALPQDYPQIDDDTKEALIAFLNPQDESPTDESPTTEKLGIIMYIEEKPGLTGHARIGRVTMSATRKTIYYAGRELRSLKGGYKANFYDVESGLEYWISNCKKGGNDTLYPGIVEIDEDAREEYWTKIRKMPENLHLTKIRSEGKHAKRRPS